MTNHKPRETGLNLLRTDECDLAEAIKLRAMANKGLAVNVFVAKDGAVYLVSEGALALPRALERMTLLGTYLRSSPVVGIEADILRLRDEVGPFRQYAVTPLRCRTIPASPVHLAGRL